MFRAEEQKRYQIFKNNMKIAAEIELYDLGTATYGASPFADLTGLYSDIWMNCVDHSCQLTVCFCCCAARQHSLALYSTLS